MNKLFILLLLLSSCNSIKRTYVDFYLGPKNVSADGWTIGPHLGIFLYSSNYPKKSVKEKYSKRKYITYNKYRKVYASYYFRKNIPIDTLNVWLDDMVPVAMDDYLNVRKLSPRIFLLIHSNLNQTDSLMIYDNHKVIYKNQAYKYVSSKMWLFLLKKMPKSIKENWMYDLPLRRNF
ncbi:MAG: hypothetical protein MUC49_21900 [Raineya sp.]|jgi:hypothetical protein|nr:hypothetical protein [Raineya sp.]